MILEPRAPFLTRRRLLGAAGAFTMAAAVVPALATPAAAAPEFAAAQKIADHFASIKTMAGEFIQFGPKGEQTGGKFFIQRPGKIRFNYEEPSPMRVISDGHQVVVGNRKLKTWQVYPLNKTPLKLLLGETIDLSGKLVRDVKEDPDLITITLGDKSIFGDSTIKMMFDPKTFDLKQWTITDNQGKETAVIIMNVETGMGFEPRVFALPAEVQESSSKQ